MSTFSLAELIYLAEGAPTVGPPLRDGPRSR